MKGHGDFEYIGGTTDDAVGEAYDKVARLLGLSQYLGGALLSKKAQECKINTIKGKLPRPMIDQDNFDFSFSGLKTATRRLIENEKLPVEVVAREFEDAVVDVLNKKTLRAVKKYGVKSLLLGGGVSANQHLRNTLESECKKVNVKFYAPPLRLCSDNAVYIVSAAYFMYANEQHTGPKIIQRDSSLGSVSEHNEPLNIDFEKLYFNMLDAKAEYLFDLPQWEAIFSVEKRKEIATAYKQSKIVRNENKIGRNDACPCGSGKKYKKCCGK